MHCANGLVGLLLLPALLGVKADNNNCVEFWTRQQAGSTSLTVQLQHSCFPADSLDTVNVASTGELGHNCQFVHSDGRCSQTVHTYNCSCDPNNTTYTISFSQESDGSTDEWEVIGKLAKSGREIKQKVNLRHKGPPTFHPPQQTFSALSGADLTADFMMRAHTDTVSNWTLQQLQPNNANALVQHADLRSRSHLQIQGTPPSLTAILTLRDVTAADEGRWRLEVVNDVGRGHADFQLTVKLTVKQDSSTGVNIAVAVVVCILLVLVPTAAVVGIRYWRKVVQDNYAAVAHHNELHTAQRAGNPLGPADEISEHGYEPVTQEREANRSDPADEISEHDYEPVTQEREANRTDPADEISEHDYETFTHEREANETDPADEISEYAYEPVTQVREANGTDPADEHDYEPVTQERETNGTDPADGPTLQRV